MGIRFGVLGPLQVEIDGRPVEVGGQKVRLLLAVLIAAGGQAVSTDHLLELLWDGSPPRTATASLHNFANRLRTALVPCGDRLRSTGGGYLLSLQHDEELDASIFTAGADRTRAAMDCQDWPAVTAEAQAALALWRGHPFTGLPALAESPEAARFSETRLLLLEWAFTAGLGAGRHRELVVDLTALASEHPLREAFHAQLMLALHGSGRTADALEVHRELREKLAEELGVDPGPLVQEAHQIVLSPAVPPAGPERASRSAVPSQLPRPVGGFIGRQHELALLNAALTAPHGAGRQGGHVPPLTVVISGMGGVGKTALAVQAADTLRAHYPDGQLYADLNGFATVQARKPQELLARFLVDLGIPGPDLPEHADDRAALFRATLAERRVLLLLDNAADSAQVVPLIPGTGNSAVIVTSRRALAGHLDGTHIVLEPLGPEGQDLLAAVCGQSRVAAEPQATERILAACGGLPLALRLAAARIANRPNWPLRVLADRLTDPPSRLELLSATDTSVRTVFAMSYQALLDSGRRAEADAARAFHRLGLWSGHPLSLEASAALLGAPLGATADMLDVLVDAHILQSPAENTYRLHDLMAGYAAELARTQETAEANAAALGRLLSWYAAAVHHADSLCWPYESKRWADLPSISAPLPKFASAEHALTWLRHEMPAIREAVRRADDCSLPHLAFAIATMLHGYGNSFWWDGQWEAVATDTLGIARAHGKRKVEADLHNLLAASHGQAGRYDDCLTHLKAAEELHAAEGNLRGLAATLGNTALLLDELGRLDEAFDAAERSAELHRQVEGRDNMVSLHGLAGLHLKSGNALAAEPIYRRVLEEFRRDRLPGPIAATLINLGDTLRHLGQQQDALAALSEAVTITETLGDHSATADALETTARAHAHFGNLAAARDCWTRALTLARQAGSTRVITDSLKGLESLTASPAP
ncbi:BTAD domain-containing putative transcriptional regulator [Kitasatospora sp. NPDC056138]|uniref:AfsR/SARP family transcriptional regulator n=1 Tax=Kitasatospora sp. NPDC056138 TaxID=3345724 RepID=UPI0035D5967E